jgi:hypothetical protein
MAHRELVKPTNTTMRKQDVEEYCILEFNRNFLPYFGSFQRELCELGYSHYGLLLYNITPGVAMLYACHIAWNHHSAKRAMEITKFESPTQLLRPLSPATKRTLVHVTSRNQQTTIFGHLQIGSSSIDHMRAVFSQCRNGNYSIVLHQFWQNFQNHCLSIVYLLNAPAHRRRANDVRLSTETRSRRSVQPVCSAIRSWFRHSWYSLADDEAPSCAASPVCVSALPNLLTQAPYRVWLCHLYRRSSTVHLIYQCNRVTVNGAFAGPPKVETDISSMPGKGNRVTLHFAIFENYGRRRHAL